MGLSSGFELGPDAFAPVGGIRALADEAKDHSLVDELSQGASGVQGTEVATAVERLAVRIGVAVVAYADRILDVADKMHACDVEYQERDQAVAQRMKQLIV